MCNVTDIGITLLFPLPQLHLRSACLAAGQTNKIPSSVTCVCKITFNFQPVLCGSQRNSSTFLEVTRFTFLRVGWEDAGAPLNLTNWRVMSLKLLLFTVPGSRRENRLPHIYCVDVTAMPKSPHLTLHQKKANSPQKRKKNTSLKCSVNGLNSLAWSTSVDHRFLMSTTE